MTKKQNKCSPAALRDDWPDFWELDASNQGPTLKDAFKVKSTPCSAFAAARVAYNLRSLLRTVNQNVHIWSEENMNKVSLNAGHIASLPLQLSESAAIALYEAVVKPVAKATGIRVTQPKETYDNNDDVHIDLDDECHDGHDGLTQEEIEELLQEIEQEEANQDDGDMPNEDGEDYV